MVLERSIGPMPEETYAYYLIQALAYGFPLASILTSIIRFLLYLLYNRKVHPFLVLIKDQKHQEHHQEQANDIELVPMVRQQPGEQPENPQEPENSQEPENPQEPEPSTDVELEVVESTQRPEESKPEQQGPDLRRPPQLRHELNLVLNKRMKPV